MIQHVSIGVRNISAAKEFYDAALAPLGYTSLRARETWAGYGKDRVEFSIRLTENPVVADPKSGLHFCFLAPTRKSVEAFHSAAVARFGPVTCLVNNAGRNSNADPIKMTEAEWDAVFAVDLKSAWLCSKVVLPAMIAARKGSIVNIASVHADHTFIGYFPYAAAKSGLVGLTRSLALEVGQYQVRVNALSPGWTETFLVAEHLESRPPDARQKVLDAHPMGRIAKPSEIANCAVFLLSGEASFVTGANWRVDGGMGARFAG